MRKEISSSVLAPGSKSFSHLILKLMKWMRFEKSMLIPDLQTECGQKSCGITGIGENGILGNGICQ